ncbi:M61 metallopeptidase family protein [Halorubrum persicum]|uniref:hypothetical protein n=1 Tax=Halorubrum persicum TaxID=1383844 RepID=UPI001181A546|nr:hypothetical protein [Halorubrum persicum]
MTNKTLWCRRAIIITCLFIAFLSVGGMATAVDAATASGPLEPDTAPPSNNSTLKEGSSNATSGSPAVSASNGIQVTYQVNRTPTDPQTVQVAYTAEIPENVVELETYLSSLEAPYSVVSTDGMSYDPTAGVVTAQSTRGTKTTVRMIYEVESNTTYLSSSELETVETAEWALIGRPQLSVSHGWSYYDPMPSFTTHYETEGDGYAANGFAFLGPAETYTRSANGQTITLVVPQAADSRTEPVAALDGLIEASDRLAVADRDSTVTGFVAPDPIRRGGVAGGSAFWVHEDSDLDIGSPWYHEYTHTRQAWVDGDSQLIIGDDVEWLTEGSADYYGGYLAWQIGGADTEAFRQYITTDQFETAVLQDLDDESFEQKNYFKGRRVLAALDIRLRQHTDGEVTLIDVLYQLNTLSKDEIRYNDFREEIVKETNESTGNWLDTYVQTTAAPTDPSLSSIEATHNAGASTPSLTISVEPNTLTATQTETVTVTATTTAGDPVDSADVRLVGVDIDELHQTNEDGIVAFNLTPSTTGTINVSVTKPGYSNATSSITVTQPPGDEPTDPTERALAITNKSDPADLSQNDVTIVITQFERGSQPNGIRLTQNDITTIITLFERY